MIALQASHLRKTYPGSEPICILKDVSLTASFGKSIAICGKSGCGKSTLLHIFGTLDSPDEGEIILCGESTRKAFLPALRNRHIGFIFQSFHLLEEYSVLDNVLMPAKIGRQPTHQGSPSHQNALSLLEEIGLIGKKDLPAKLLSGGEKQRASLARAFCNNPSLILADEPTGNLDAAHARQIQELLLGCAKKQDKALIVVTHDPEFASLCDEIYELKEGVLLNRTLPGNAPFC